MKQIRYKLTRTKMWIIIINNCSIKLLNLMMNSQWSSSGWINMDFGGWWWKANIYSMVLNVNSSDLNSWLMWCGAVKCNNYFRKIIALGWWWISAREGTRTFKRTLRTSVYKVEVMHIAVAKVKICRATVFNDSSYNYIGEEEGKK